MNAADVQRSVGKSFRRVDAVDKVTARAKYTDDLADSGALIVKILHSTIANGLVAAMDVSEAAKVPGVEKIITCFEVPDIPFPTAGHPWSTDPHHQDVADRLLLNRRVRYYGDEIAAVIARDEIAATRALRLIRVTYDAYPFVLDPIEACKDGAPQLHERFANNILGHNVVEHGDFAAAVAQPGLRKVEGWYETPTVQHCHIENHICFAEEQNGKLTVVSSTQIPHIVRRVVGQALGIPWGQVRIIKPYIGGGFGNKQDALYEPLCAYCSQKMGGRLVKLDVSREETFVSNRVRHAIKAHLVSYVRPDGRLVARSMEAYSNQGAYASHGHGIVMKAATGFTQLYHDELATKTEVYSVFTNTPASGAMRGYGIPQSMFITESHTDDVAKAVGMDPLAFRKLNMMQVGFYDGFYKFENYTDSLGQCMEKGRAYIDYDRKRAEYAHQTGPVRRGVGMSIFWYNTAVWPISLESSSCRMVLNQDGSVQLQTGETEIGQGCDTVYAQMAAETIGVPFESVHVNSTQDTDFSPFGTGAYASRQTYIGGFSIRQTGLLLRERILAYADRLTRFPAYDLDLIDGKIVHKTNGKTLMTLGELATEALYSLTASEHITAESTYQIRTNALSLGCAFAEVEVDIPLCKVKLLKLINVHDCGNLINPQLAEAQVHGGMSMSIGFGLSEKLIFDPKTGRVLNNNLLDYKISTTMDHPDLSVAFVENAEPSNPFGTKALGEPPAVPGAPAIRNAVLQATGVAVNEAPLTPHVLFRRFTEEGLL